MSYPSSDRPSRFVGEGFRVEPEFRQASGTPEGSPESEPVDVDPFPSLGLPPVIPPPRAVTAAELDGVFDDPHHGEPGRDRLGVHFVWEAVLLVATVAMAFGLNHSVPGSLSGSHLRALMVSATIMGLLGLAAGISLRAGAANLAIGPIMVVSGLYFAVHVGDGFYHAAGVSLLIALACGLAIALVAGVFHVPGWAVSLGAFFAIQVWLSFLPSAATLTTRYDANGQGYYWFGGFALIALIGGGLGTVRPIRRAVGRTRPIGDPADRRGLPAAVVTALAVVGSALLAGLAGIGLAMQSGSAASTDGIMLTGSGFAIALLGGTSVFGRRGGVFGTLLATALLGLVTQYVLVHSWHAGPAMVVAIAIGIGVIVTRLVEVAGRPRRGGHFDSSTTWLGRQQGSWANQMPVRPADEPTWVDASDERWGVR